MAINFSNIGNSIKGLANKQTFDASKNATITQTPTSFGEGFKNVLKNTFGDGGYGDLKKQYDDLQININNGTAPSNWKEQQELMKNRLALLEQENQKKKDFKDKLLSAFTPQQQVPNIQWNPIDIPVNPPQRFDEE